MSDVVSLEKRLSEEAEWMYDWNNKGMDAIPLETIKEELRVSAFKVDSIFTSFSKVMASCKNDNFLEDFYNKTLKWLNKTRREILKELVEPESFSVKDSPKNSKESNVKR